MRLPASPPSECTAAVVMRSTARGGAIGPELNYPLSPVEYRESAWLRRWIDDPSQILATSRMPRLNPGLADRDQTISNLLAYLEVMSKTKPKLRAETKDGS